MSSPSKAAQLQKNKPRLGRGLSSLISVDLPTHAEPAHPPAHAKLAPTGIHGTIAAKALVAPTVTSTPAPAPAPEGRPAEIPLAKISPNPSQPRKNINDAGIAELAASLKSNGVIQPIVLRKIGESYQLIAGERRWRAAKLAGLTTIPAILRDVDGFTQAQMALVENIHREDLNPIERAAAYRMLIEQLGLTQAELAGRLGEDRSTVANFLRLLDLADAVKTLVSEGKVSLGHAKLLAGLPDRTEQQRLADLVVSQGLSVRNLERLLAEAPKPVGTKDAPVTGGAHFVALEKSIARQLGMRVQVKQSAKKGKGRVVIHYGSLDQFDDLMGKLGVSPDA